MPIPDYHDRLNLDLLRFIPPDARVVLEIGCGTGALAEAYRRINPDVRYIAVEKHTAAAETARSASRADLVFTGDVESFDPASLELAETNPSVDCLVLGDILEHLVDPWSVLQRLARLVRGGGQVVACIPNVQHYSVLINLLRGNWEYQAEGLLDRTHLRFFTLQGIQQLFTQSNLQILDIQPRWWPDAEFDRFQKLVAPVLSALTIEPATFAVQTRAVQYLVRAVQTAAQLNRMLIWSLLGSVIGSELRIAVPGRFLSTIPGVRVQTGTGVQFDHLGKTWPGEARVFIEQRVIIPRADHVRLQRALLAQGYLIIGEIDDDPDHFAELANTDYFALKSCHCLQTTTEIMANTLRVFNPNVAVFPNQVATLAPPRLFCDNSHAPEQLTLFFGALNREADWAPVLPELNRVLTQYGARVHVQVVYDRAFFDALATPHKTFEPLCSYDRYHEVLHNADIALLPLEPTRFNQHKSDLKFIECAAHGVTVLASATVYGTTILPGGTGLVYETPDHFGVMLEQLIENSTLRHRLGENAWRYVAESRLLARHYRARHKWYCQMVAHREALTLELIRRVPDLTGS